MKAYTRSDEVVALAAELWRLRDALIRSSVHPVRCIGGMFPKTHNDSLELPGDRRAYPGPGPALVAPQLSSSVWRHGSEPTDENGGR